jgi:hypothetical protein
VADALIVDGKPAKITIHDFRRHHLMSFPALTDTKYDSLITEAIDRVYTWFPFVHELWDWHPEQLWFDKTSLCYRDLTAWHITDRYPKLSAANYDSIGGVPLHRKKIDGVDLTFDRSAIQGSAGEKVDNPISSLRSNHFGRMALMMMRMSAKRALLRNCPYV